MWKFSCLVRHTDTYGTDINFAASLLSSSCFSAGFLLHLSDKMKKFISGAIERKTKDKPDCLLP